jgi:catechol 2,3-dioxygenase-like lactoylglutathione lyase family enzyme
MPGAYALAQARPGTRPARRIRLDDKVVARYRNNDRLEGEMIALIQNFDHTSFTVADIERAVVFWRDVMGFAVADLSTREGDWLGAVVGVPGALCRIAHLHGHGAHLEFIAYLTPAGGDVTRPPNRPGSAHVAFLVTDIEAMATRMIEAGVSEQGRIARCTSGPAAGCLAVYLKDPNGIIVELAPARADRRRPPGSAGAESKSRGEQNA